MSKCEEDHSAHHELNVREKYRKDENSTKIHSDKESHS